MKMIPILLVASALLSSCVSIPTGNIEAFGIATADVTNMIDTVISDYNKAKVNNELVKMAQSNRKFVKSDMDPIKKIVIRDSDIKSFALYKANVALGNYAKALTALASAGSRESLALAGANLSRSLKGMNEQYKILKGSEKDLIGDESSGKISRVVAEISAYYADYKRGKALKEIIIAANPSIQMIGKVISEQLLSGVIEGRLYAMKSNELAGYFSEYNANVEKLSFSQKKKALDDIYDKYIIMESTSATVFQAQKAIVSVMRAHNELSEELKNDHYDSKRIAAALQGIGKVNKDFEDLEALMKNC